MTKFSCLWSTRFTHTWLPCRAVPRLYSGLDQLTIARASGTAFQEFQEGPLCFPPSYKYTPGTKEYDQRRVVCSSVSPMSALNAFRFSLLTAVEVVATVQICRNTVRMTSQFTAPAKDDVGCSGPSPFVAVPCVLFLDTSRAARGPSMPCSTIFSLMLSR